MHRFKQFYISIIVLFLFTATITVSFAVNVETGGKHKLRIAGDINYPPFEFMSDGDTLTYRGYNVDVMHAIAIETGIEIEFVPLTWNEAKKALLEGKVDAIQGMIKTSSREYLYDFSDAYYMSKQVIFVSKDVNDISGIEDFKGRVIALQRGDANDELMSSIRYAKIRLYEDQNSAIDALAKGEVDVMLGNKSTGVYHIQRTHKSDLIKIVGETVMSNEYCVSVKKGNMETLKLINEGIHAIKEKGTLEKINKKWFGETIESQKNWKSLVILSFIVSVGLSLLLGLIFYVNKKLHHQVAIRTAELTNSNEVIELKDAQKWHILNGISNGIIVFDQLGKVTLFNQKSRDIVENCIVLGMHWSEIELCRTLGLELFDNALSLNTELRGNTSFVNSKLESLYIQYALTPVSYKTNTTDELIFMVNDNTQEKIFHDVLSQNEKLSTLGKMSASIAHELRNPLASIKQYIDIMPLKSDNVAFMKQAMSVLPSELDRLNGIVEGLLDYTKFAKSKKENISLMRVIKEISNLLKVEFLHRRVKLILEVDAVDIYIDAKQLKQILINLLINALDALPIEGGVIIIKGYAKNQNSVIEVLDNGSGIPANQLTKIFEPYYTTKPTGYGMGLGISKQLVEENDGIITVESKMNQGTCFKLEFSSK